jgi:hypothetical protein
MVSTHDSVTVDASLHAWISKCTKLSGIFGILKSPCMNVSSSLLLSVETGHMLESSLHFRVAYIYMANAPLI